MSCQLETPLTVDGNDFDLKDEIKQAQKYAEFHYCKCNPSAPMVMNIMGRTMYISGDIHCGLPTRIGESKGMAKASGAKKIAYIEGLNFGTEADIYED